MILNLTQHAASPEQLAAGVVEPRHKHLVTTRLTFDRLPSKTDIDYAVEGLVSICQEWRANQIDTLVHHTGISDSIPYSHMEVVRNVVRPQVMIGGAPFLMAPLHAALVEAGFIPVYAFSERVSTETTDGEGNTVKTSVFAHKGFVGGY